MPSHASIRSPRLLSAFAVCLAGFSLAGCENPEYSFWGGGRANAAGPVQLLTGTSEHFSTARLATMIDSMQPPVKSAAGDALPTSDGDTAADVARLDRAIANFAKAPYEVTKAKRADAQNRLRDARNSIQDQLIFASNNRCNVYKTQIRRLSASTGFGLGSLATVAGAAGAIVTGAASQALAATASAATGVNAEYQKDFFNGLVTSVIIPGIDRQRADLRNDIVAKSCASISDYPLTLAISEAIRYHGACSADVGISASGQAIARVSPDSLSTVLAATQQIKKINGAFNTPTQVDVARLAKAVASAEADATSKSVRATSAETRYQNAVAAAGTTPDATTQATIDKLEASAVSVRQAADGAARRAAGLKAQSDNIGSARADTIDPGTGLLTGTAWVDPLARSKPLIGDTLVITDCRPLDADGKPLAITTK